MTVSSPSLQRLRRSRAAIRSAIRKPRRVGQIRAGAALGEALVDEPGRRRAAGSRASATPSHVRMPSHARSAAISRGVDDATTSARRAGARGSLGAPRGFVARIAPPPSAASASDAAPTPSPRNGAPRQYSELWTARLPGRAYELIS